MAAVRPEAVTTTPTVQPRAAQTAATATAATVAAKVAETAATVEVGVAGQAGEVGTTRSRPARYLLLLLATTALVKTSTRTVVWCFRRDCVAVVTTATYVVTHARHKAPAGGNPTVNLSLASIPSLLPAEVRKCVIYSL